MGNILCVPNKKSSFAVPVKIGMDPLGTKKSKRSRTSKVSALTYRDTWSSFLKSVQGEKVPYFPTKSPPQRRCSVRFVKSWDDDVIVYNRKSCFQKGNLRSRQTRSASPRSRNAVHPASKTISKIEGRALREAWLQESVWPTFGDPPVLESNPKVGRKPTRGDSLEANPSSDSSDIHLTPDSMEVNAVSTLTTTSDSLNVNVTSSSPTSTFDSMSPFCYSLIRQPENSSVESSHSLLQTTSSTSLNTSTKANVSSSDNSVQDIVNRDIGKSPASQRKVLSSKRSDRESGQMPPSCRKYLSDPCREEWTKEYLYKAPRRQQIYLVQGPRLWKSTPNLSGAKSREQLLQEFKHEKRLEEEAYRQLRRKTRSLTLLRSSSFPRLQSASRSRKNSAGSRSCLKSSQEISFHERDSAGKGQQKRDSQTPLKSSLRSSHSRIDDIDKYELQYYKSKSQRPKTASTTQILAPVVSLQPASGDNKASVLRKTMTKKRIEDQSSTDQQLKEREREKHQRWRAIRLDPAWTRVAGGGKQALKDIASRKCYKEYIERQRMMKFQMEMEHMLNRVWQMPPLFARDPSAKMTSKGLHGDRKTSRGPTIPEITMSAPTDCPGTTQNSRYVASDTLQLSRPSTAKSSQRSARIS